MSQRILICGDRNWTNKELIRHVLNSMKDIEAVIEGECRGADILGKQVAEEMGIFVVKFPADWLQYGKSAGPIRNQQMLNEGQPTKVIAFHNNINESKGTKDMLKRAKKRGIAVLLVSE